MKSFSQIVLIPLVFILTVKLSEGRDLRDLREGDASTGLLLSALCIEDGQLRNACLEDISSLSIQKFLDKLVGHVRDSDRYNTLMRDLDLGDVKDGVIATDNMVPDKRGRPRQASGFYSNW